MIRLAITTVALLLVIAAACAQPHGWDPNSPMGKWINSLHIPDDIPPKSTCCGPADAYAIRITEDAIGDTKQVCMMGCIKPTPLMGTAIITDGSAKEFPDHTFRTPLPNGTVIHFNASQVNPLSDGNPTSTAWAFLSVAQGTTPDQNSVNRVYCIIPLPPGS